MKADGCGLLEPCVTYIFLHHVTSRHVTSRHVPSRYVTSHPIPSHPIHQTQFEYQNYQIHTDSGMERDFPNVGQIPTDNSLQGKCM